MFLPGMELFFIRVILFIQMIIKSIIVLMFICLGESVELICYELLLIYLISR